MNVTIIKRQIICKGCGEEKENHAKNLCKLCYNKKWRENNKELFKKGYKKYYQRNREYIIKQQSRYNQINKEHIKEQKRKYHQDNKEHFRKQKKWYYQTNKKHIKECLVKRLYGVSLKEYNKIIEKCYLCNYTRTIDCHHLNGKKDNSRLIGLCPNHHRLLHINKLNQVEQNKINNMR